MMSEFNLNLKNFSSDLFSSVFQSGFFVKSEIGVSVRDFLNLQFGISSEYIEKRISTIFLDGKPVDDIDKSKVHNGTVLSLSAALPGLVGATMRRGGFYSSFRSSITYHEADKNDSSFTGLVCIKLFNMIKEEIGINFLKHGIYLEGRECARLFAEAPVFFNDHNAEALRDGERTSLDDLKEELMDNSDLKVIVRGEELAQPEMDLKPTPF